MAKMKAFISSCSNSSEGGTSSSSSSSSASFSSSNKNNNNNNKNSGAGFKPGSWIRSCSLSSSKKKNRPQNHQPFSLNRAMKKARLSDFCCTGASSAAGDEESRAMMNASPSPSSNHHISTCSSSGSNPPMNLAAEAPASQEWMEIKDLHDSGVPDSSNSKSKRVMVVVDESREAKTALLWALSHVVSKSDVVTLLYVLQGNAAHYYCDAAAQDSRAIIPDRTRLRCEEKRCEFITSLKALCSLRQPEVDVEVVVIAGEKGDRGPAIVRQAKKLDASILILGHKKLNFLQRCLRWNREDQLADYCIQHADCHTLSVRAKSKQCGGYLINSKWQRNFWLLA